jgi:uncharacterized protein DUF5681
VSAEYEVGYKKPPRHTRFKPGNPGNPRGRGKTEPENEAEILRRLANSPAEYSSGGKVYRATNLEIVIKKLGSLACAGDVQAAHELLKMRAHYEKFGDVNPRVCLALINMTAIEAAL